MVDAMTKDPAVKDVTAKGITERLRTATWPVHERLHLHPVLRPLRARRPHAAAAGRYRHAGCRWRRCRTAAGDGFAGASDFGGQDRRPLGAGRLGPWRPGH